MDDEASIIYGLEFQVRLNCSLFIDFILVVV